MYYNYGNKEMKTNVDNYIGWELLGWNLTFLHRYDMNINTVTLISLDEISISVYTMNIDM